MPTPRTEATEIAVGFGLLNSVINNRTNDEIKTLFEGTLSYDKYLEFVKEYERDLEKYQDFYTVGNLLRENYPLLSNVEHIRWTGPERQAGIVGIAQDLLANNIPISVKDNSNVVLNPSPYNLFEIIPSGQLHAASSSNWYIESDYSAAQAVYSMVRERGKLYNLPSEYSVLEKKATPADREEIQGTIKKFQELDNNGIFKEFNDLYVRMCRNVAQTSADQFNSILAKTLQTHIRTAVKDNIIKQFFRINSVNYVLAGIEKNNQFAVIIPGLTKWKQNWNLSSVLAVPQLKRRQSVVRFEVEVENRQTHDRYNLQFHAEVRWSHGKFCGNPEAKLYKDFDLHDVPFFENII